MNDAMGETSATVSQHLSAATRLLDAVRSSGRQRDIMPFLAHLRSAAAASTAAMVEAAAALDRGGLGDPEFAKVHATGSAHGALMAFCQSHRDDPSERVRQACAAGMVVLTEIEVKPEFAQVILAMQDRLGRMS